MAGFPFVPIAAGVPALLRSAGIVVPTPALIFADAVAYLFGFDVPQWGLFQNGVPVVVADSVVSLNYRKQWAISEHPVEEGAFESYDKVETPFDATVRFTAGGSPDRREALLASIEAIAGDTELYDVVMPERVFESANVTSYSFARSATNGVGLMTVDVRITEVRVTAQSDYSATKSPTGASQVNNGTVQAQPYTGPNLGPLQGTPN